MFFCTDFCHVPSISSASGGSSWLRLYFSHLQGTETSILYAYTAITRELGTFTWKETVSRLNFGPQMFIDAGYLKPFTNYTVRIFPRSFLGDRLGSEARIFQTKEAGMKCTKTTFSIHGSGKYSEPISTPSNYTSLM